MGIQSIRWDFPCCHSAHLEQTKFSKIARSVIASLAAIAVFVSMLALGGVPGLHAIGTVGCATLTAAAAVLILAAVSLKCVKSRNSLQAEELGADQHSLLKDSFDAVFVALENKQDEAITQSLVTLKRAFSQPVHLASAMEVYKIHRAIMHITHVAAKQMQSHKQEWQAFLERFNGYAFTVKDSYPLRLDLSIANGVLNGQFPLTTCGLLNLEELTSRQKFIDFLIEMDNYSFRDNHSREFLNKMLESKEARAFVAYHGNRIVGGLWGFFTQYEGRKIFHAWLLIIRPDFSSLGIGKQLIEFAQQQSRNYPDVTMATLNVDRYNKHAKMLYDQGDFKSLSDQADKTFMGRSLTKDQTIQLSEETAKNIVKDYVLKSASVFELAYWEMSRQSALFSSKAYWSYKNPNYETLNQL